MLNYLTLNAFSLKCEKVFCDIIWTSISCSNGENIKCITMEVITGGWGGGVGGGLGYRKVIRF